MLYSGNVNTSEHEHLPWPIGPRSLALQELKGVTLFVEEDTLLACSAQFVIVNESEHTITFGQSYFIQIKIHGEWYTINEEETMDLAFLPLAQDVLPSTRTDEHERNSSELNLLWKHWGSDRAYGHLPPYGILPTGSYRLVKSIVYDFVESEEVGNTWQEAYLIAEFIID